MELAGAQHVLLSQAAWFHRQGYSVQAAFFYDKQGLQARWSKQYSFPIHSLAGWKRGSFVVFNLARLLAALWKLGVLLGNAQIVVSFTPHSNLLALPIALLRGVKVRIGTHHGYIEGSSRLLQRMHGWLTNSRASSVMVCVSEQVRALAIHDEGARPEKLRVIQNGIESPVESGSRTQVREQLGLREGQALLITVGRLVQQKGHAVLLDAIAELTDQNSVFAFVGEGFLHDELMAKVRRLGLQHRVLFLGPRNDVPGLLAAADIFVQPSIWEGLSIALLEALFAGLPVIATRVEGVVDVVEDGRSALLVASGNSSELTRAIDRLLKDKQLRNQLAMAGRQLVQSKYTLDAMCEAYEDLIIELSDAV